MRPEEARGNNSTETIPIRTGADVSRVRRSVATARNAMHLDELAYLRGNRLFLLSQLDLAIGLAITLGLLDPGLLGQLGATNSWFGIAREWLLGDPPQMVAAGQEEMQNRGESGAFLPLVAKVPARVDFLYGQSYLAAIFFFVPRAIWEGKPRGVGPMTNAYIYNDEVMRDPGQMIRGSGIPPGAMGEAYWNFYYPGVVLVYMLYGMFNWWLAALLRRNADVPAVWVVYALTLLMSPTSTIIVGWLQSIIPGIAMMWWMGVLRRRPRVMLRHAAA